MASSSRDPLVCPSHHQIRSPRTEQRDELNRRRKKKTPQEGFGQLAHATTTTPTKTATTTTTINDYDSRLASSTFLPASSIITYSVCLHPSMFSHFRSNPASRFVAPLCRCLNQTPVLAPTREIFLFQLFYFPILFLFWPLSRPSAALSRPCLAHPSTPPAMALSCTTYYFDVRSTYRLDWPLKITAVVTLYIF